MSAGRKALWRWEPLWYILLFVLVFITSVLQAVESTVAFVVFLVLTIVVAAAILVAIVIGAIRGPRNPDASGNLASPDGLELLPARETDAPRVVVADTKRHQNAIDAAAAFAGGTLSAILVPGATSWMGLRLRVGVQLVTGNRVFLAGYLPAELESAWNELLLPLRRRGLYLEVPAAVHGDRRPYVVDLDLGSAIDIANGQSASS